VTGSILTFLLLLAMALSLSLTERAG